jgi:hypothetical protein
MNEELVHPNGVTTIEPPFGSRRVLVKLTVASTSIEFGPCPLVDFGESDPKVSSAAALKFQGELVLAPWQESVPVPPMIMVTVFVEELPSGEVRSLMVTLESFADYVIAHAECA